MLDVSIAYNRYRFLGNEFLTWLYYLIDAEPQRVTDMVPEVDSLTLGNRMVIENRKSNDSTESITIKGDDAGLEEALTSLNKGGQVTEMNLVCHMGDNRWQFTLKGESLNMSSVKTPDIAPTETGEDTEGAVLEKTYLIEKVILLINTLYQHFIKLRISDSWKKDTLNRMRPWIRQAESSASADSNRSR